MPFMFGGPDVVAMEHNQVPRCSAVVHWLLLAIMIAGCGAASQRRATRSLDAVVKVTCNVPSAEIWLDERYVAEVGTVVDGIAMAPGSHQLVIRHDDYHTFYGELTVEPREQRVLVTTLAAKLH